MKVLVVDDDEIVRRALNRALSRRGHVVVEAGDGEEGRSCWIAENPDIVLLDVIMPKKTGIQVMKERSSLPHAKVVLISAYSGESAEAMEAQQQADLFIRKPFDNIFKVVEMIEGLNE